MDLKLPANAPKTTEEGFAYTGGMVKHATVDDLRVLALVEAIGLELYEDLARRTDHPVVQQLLRDNGREEMVHATRIAKAIEILTGEPFPIPPLEQIPFFTPLKPMPCTRAALTKLAAGENAGEQLYAAIAAHFDNAEVVALLHQNGKEEVEHGGRLMQAAALLPA